MFPIMDNEMDVNIADIVAAVQSITIKRGRILFHVNLLTEFRSTYAGSTLNLFKIYCNLNI